MSQLNNEYKEILHLSDAYLETLNLFLNNRDKLMTLTVKEPNFFEVNVYCKYHYVVKNNFDELRNDAMATVKDLELLKMIQHFVSNIDLENSHSQRLKGNILF